MRTVGTVLEWDKMKSDAYISNDKLQIGVSIRLQKYSKKGINCTYESHTPGGDPWIYFGSKCAYLVTGRVQYRVYATYGMNGGVTALSTALAEDPTWFEVDPIEYYESSINL